MRMQFSQSDGHVLTSTMNCLLCTRLLIFAIAVLLKFVFILRATYKMRKCENGNTKLALTLPLILDLELNPKPDFTCFECYALSFFRILRRAILRCVDGDTIAHRSHPTVASTPVRC